MEFKAISGNRLNICAITSFFFIFFSFIIVQVFAQQGVEYIKDSNSLLWEISGKNMKDTSYLFGTYHFAGHTFIDTLPAINKVFRQAKTIVGEKN